MNKQEFSEAIAKINKHDVVRVKFSSYYGESSISGLAEIDEVGLFLLIAPGLKVLSLEDNDAMLDGWYEHYSSIDVVGHTSFAPGSRTEEWVPIYNVTHGEVKK